MNDEGHGRLPAIQARTRARHARPREHVEQQIERFLSRPSPNPLA
jgi:hypothetical protein